ncbi:MAG: hypothetical protein ACRDWT_10315 [Jatrophihabitantaceae bacterium]
MFLRQQLHPRALATARILEEAGLLMMGLGSHAVKHYNVSLGLTILG